MVTIDDVRAARARIAGYVRETPLISTVPARAKASAHGSITLKLECMQIIGSFKARGAVNRLLTSDPEQVKRGIITASGGNHGLGVAYVGWLAKCPVTIFVGGNTPELKIRKLEGWGARVIKEGAVWDDANRAALAHAEREELLYMHPFADPAVIAGQGTITLEILDHLPDVDTLLVSIGGGGLISGVSLAAKALNPDIRIIGVEPTGAPKIFKSMKAGRLIELDAVHTRANTLAPRTSAPINWEIIRRCVDQVVLVSDDEMLDAARWLYREFGIAAELSGAATVAALLSRRYEPRPVEKVCALVCGAGSDGVEDMA
jgi:threonine dehydratase